MTTFVSIVKSNTPPGHVVVVLDALATVGAATATATAVAFVLAALSTVGAATSGVPSIVAVCEGKVSVEA